MRTRSKIFVTFAIFLASSAISGEGGTSDSISYQHPEYYDSMVFYTDKVVEENGEAKQWFKEEFKRFLREDFTRIRMAREKQFLGIKSSSILGKELIEIPLGRLRRLILPTDIYFDRCNKNYRERHFDRMGYIISDLKKWKNAPESKNELIDLLEEYKNSSEIEEKESLAVSKLKKRLEGIKSKNSDKKEKFLKKYERITEEIAIYNKERAPCSSQGEVNKKNVLPQKDQVKVGDDITLIVNKLRLPVVCRVCQWFMDDIAAIVDVDTGESSKKEPVIVKYVRDIENYGTMDFRDLTVYTDDTWNGKTMPYLRFRLIDVNADDNDDMEAFLAGTAQVVGQLSTLTMNPAINSYVNVGIAAAKILLTNAKNEAILDYEFQMYTSKAIESAGDSELVQLKKGIFVITALPEEHDYTANQVFEFWNQDIYIDTKTGFLLRFGDAMQGDANQDDTEKLEDYIKYEIINSPVLIGILMTHSSGIPGVIGARTAEIQDKLMRKDFVSQEEYKKLGESLKTALQAYGTENELRFAENKDEANKLVCDLLESMEANTNLGSAEAMRIKKAYEAATDKKIGVEEFLSKDRFGGCTQKTPD